MRHIPAILLIPLLYALQADLHAAIEDPPSLIVRTEAGAIRGDRIPHLENGRVFKGIPYAAPPTGPRRWLPPQPVEPWEGVRETTTFSDVCPQPSVRLIPRVRQPQSEDCLYLNIWTTRTEGDKAPVLVWLHGGGFTIGAGSQSMYAGDQFAASGAVLVTINYRLGPFGFFAHPAIKGAKGNQGLLDQIAALQWVRDNIIAFGGNPDNVTVFGESAGSVAVGCLLTMPDAEGLFHRAIMQSGAPMFDRTLHGDGGTMMQCIDLAERCGIETPDGIDDATHRALYDLSADVILEHADARVGLFGAGQGWGPCIDGDDLPEPPLQRMAVGRHHQVPVIVGSNDDEATLFLPQLQVRRMVGYRLLVRSIWGRRSAAIFEAFPVKTDDDVHDALVRLVSVAAFNEPARRTARALDKGGSDVWLYAFTRDPATGRRTDLGATHGVEITYIFGALGNPARVDPIDAAISRYMHDTWVRFARTGRPDDPDNADAQSWPAFDTAGDMSMRIGTTQEARTGYRAHECDVIEANPMRTEQPRQRRR